MRTVYNTRSKKVIIQYLSEHKDCQFSVTDLYEYLHCENCKVNQTTIYRILSKLVEEELVLQYRYPDRKETLYQYVDQSSSCLHHLHMKCQNCGSVLHLECEFMDEIEHHLSEHHGFIISCKDSVLTGICNKCQNHIS